MTASSAVRAGSRATVAIAAAMLPIVVTALVHCSSGPSSTGGGGMDGSSIELGVPRSHRVSAATCTVPRVSFATMDAGRNNQFATCHADADCTMGDSGRCQNVYNSMACDCNYDDCTTDADCSSGGACVCRTTQYPSARNRCVPRGNCLFDADCGAGGYCSPSMLLGDTCDGDNIAYYCHTADDECVDDFQCTQGYCLFDPAKKHWRCNEYPGCDSGIFPVCQ